ncbi:MAG: hypothetical protein ACRDZN_13725 [Acidimicrobiales bacterium]
MVTDVASAFAPPGENEYTVADLEAGEYIALCFIPTGMTSEEARRPRMRCRTPCGAWSPG